MQGLASDKDLLIKIATEELTPTQVRLIKSVHSLMAHVLAAEDESEYFEASAELLKKAAEIIKQAQFAQKNKDISYGEQAVEFAVDFLSEALRNNGIHSIDN
jgi:hypothetical protein